MEATPGIEIQGKRLSASRSASNSQSIAHPQRYESRLSLGFPLSVHEVVPNPYQHLNHQSGITRFFKVRAQPSVRLLLSPVFSQQKGNLEATDC